MNRLVMKSSCFLSLHLFLNKNSGAKTKKMKDSILSVSPAGDASRLSIIIREK